MTRKLNGTFARWLTHGGGQEIINADIARRKKLPKRKDINMKARKAFRTGIPILMFALFAFMNVHSAFASTAPLVETYQTCLRITTGSVTDIKLSGAIVKALNENKVYYLGDTSYACSAIAEKIQGNFPVGSLVEFTSAQNSYFPLTYEFVSGGWILHTTPIPEAKSDVSGSLALSMSSLWEARIAIAFYALIFAVGLITGYWIIKRIW